MIKKIASLLRSIEMKWFLALLWFVIFSGAVLTGVGKAPTYVPVVYYFIFWIGLLATLDHHGEMEKFLKEQSDELEKVVRVRTKNLEKANLELKRINEFTLGRELRIVELKDKIKKLEDQVLRTSLCSYLYLT